MNITYTGKHGEWLPDQQRKLDEKFAKLGKLIERKGSDKAAHVAITTTRQVTSAEITMNFHDHGLVGAGEGSDVFTAVCAAVDKLEKQALKVRTKWRDTTRGSSPKGVDEDLSANPPAAIEEDEAEEGGDAGPKVFRVHQPSHRKPMTVEEAILAIEGRAYLVYRDADQDCVSVLIRRPDGNFDLVES